MQSAEYDHNDFSNTPDADKALAVKFFLKERKDNDRTMAEGRPIFKEVEYIDIRGAGKTHAMACRPATYQDKQRFPKHYAAFKQRIEMPVEGTPLSEWPQISRSQIEEFAFLNIKTVEQMIAMSDTNAMKFHGGLNLKRKAAEWLEAADGTKLIAEKQMLQDENARLKVKQEDTDEKIAALQRQVENLVGLAEEADLHSQKDVLQGKNEALKAQTAILEAKAEDLQDQVDNDKAKLDPLEEVPIKKRRLRRAASKG